MAYSNYLLSVWFRILGDEVEPAAVSKLFGLACTEGRQKGEQYSVSLAGKPICAKTGLWVLESSIDSKSIPAHLEHLSGLLRVTRTELDSAVRPIRAYFDVFVAMSDSPPDESSSLSFDLPPSLIKRLDALGYLVEFTFDYCTPDPPSG